MGVESRLGADLNRPCGSNKNEERNAITKKVSEDKINLNPKWTENTELVTYNRFSQCYKYKNTL